MKYFPLLVVHGALLVYLILHNIIMPLMRGSFSFGYWFAPHVLLWILFFRWAKFEKYSPFIPGIIWSIFYTSVIFLISLIIELKHFKMERAHSTLIITLFSNFIFLSIFYFKFKKLFPWKNPIWTHFQLIFWVILAFKVARPVQLEAVIIPPKRLPRILEYQLPLDIGKSFEVNISKEGFSPKVLLVPSFFSVKNMTSKRLPLRLLAYKNHRWHLIKPISLRPGAPFKWTPSTPGIYLLRTMNKSIPGATLIYFQHAFPMQGAYFIDKKGIHNDRKSSGSF